MNTDMRRKISEILDLPKDVLLDLVRVTVTGKLAVFIENHKGIVEYNSNLIRVNTNDGVIVLKGKDLYLKSAVADEITVEGKLQSIEFEE